MSKFIETIKKIVKNKYTIIKVVDTLLLLTIAIGCGYFTIRGISGDTNYNYSLVACGFLLAITIHLILFVFSELDFSKKQNHLSELIIDNRKIILNSYKLTVTSFKGEKTTDIVQDADLYIANKIKNALKCVYDLTWQDYGLNNPNPRNIPDRNYSEKKIDESIEAFCAKENVIYQEIFTFSDSRSLPKLKRHLKYGDNYNSAYYNNLNNAPLFPKMNFVIIDEEEVIFVSSAYGNSMCAIRDKKIVEICSIYFKQAWKISEKIKDVETKPDTNKVITEIEEMLNRKL